MRPNRCLICPGREAVLTSHSRVPLVAVMFALATLRFDEDAS
jgi:hypothetical protein